MREPKPVQQPKDPQPPARSKAQTERLARALRANLKRRRDQQQARAKPASDGEDEASKA